MTIKDNDDWLKFINDDIADRNDDIDDKIDDSADRNDDSDDIWRQIING